MEAQPEEQQPVTKQAKAAAVDRKEERSCAVYEEAVGTLTTGEHHLAMSMSLRQQFVWRLFTVCLGIWLVSLKMKDVIYSGGHSLIYSLIHSSFLSHPFPSLVGMTVLVNACVPKLIGDVHIISCILPCLIVMCLARVMCSKHDDKGNDTGH